MPANVHNILPSWAKKTPLSQVPFFRFCQIVRNILHTAGGIDRGNGPGSEEGLGWWFGERPESKSGSLIPELWSSRLDYASLELQVYVGDGNQPWFISADGETGYAGSVTGWQHVTAGEYYITMTSSLSPSFGSTAPDYSAGRYGVKVGTVASGNWTKKFAGPFQISVPPGDSTNTALSWDNANGKWIKATPSAAPGTLTEVTYVTAVQFDASSKQLQIRTRTGKVYDPGTESGWTNAHQAAAFSD